MRSDLQSIKCSKWFKIYGNFFLRGKSLVYEPSKHVFVHFSPKRSHNARATSFEGEISDAAHQHTRPKCIYMTEHLKLFNALFVAFGFILTSHNKMINEIKIIFSLPINKQFHYRKEEKVFFIFYD